MTPEKAAAIAMWAAFDYAAPHPPKEAAELFMMKLAAMGFHIVPVGGGEQA